MNKKYTITLLDNKAISSHTFSFDKRVVWLFNITLFLMTAFSYITININNNLNITKTDLQKVFCKNKLMYTKTAILNKKIEELNYRTVAQRKSTLTLNGLTAKKESSEKAITLGNDFQQIHIQKKLLGRRLMSHKIMLGDKLLFEYFVDIDRRKKEQRLIAEQKINDIKNNLQEIINKGDFYKEINIFNVAEDEYIGLIDNLMVFAVGKQDSDIHQIPTEKLAQDYKEILQKELKNVKMNISAKGNPTLKTIKLLKKNPSLKQLTNHLSRKLNYIADTMIDDQVKIAEIYNTSIKLKSKYAKTPSISPLYYTYITSPYGYRVHPVTKRHTLHTGIDFSAYIGSKIRSTADGRVIYAGWLNGYGKAIKIYHGFGIMTLYAHCSKIYVKRGQYVKKNKLIARSGNTGLVAGPHLHYEVRKWNEPVDPVAYLSKDILTAKNDWELAD